MLSAQTKHGCILCDVSLWGLLRPKAGRLVLRSLCYQQLRVSGEGRTVLRDLCLFS